LTLRQLAQRLGLSITTVSRALGGYQDVSAATRARVLAEAERVRYRPNQLARRLQSGRSGAVGMVLPTAPGYFDDPFFMRMLAAIGPALAAAELDLLVMTASPGTQELKAYRHLAEVHRIDGMLLARTCRHDHRIGYLIDQQVPFVAHGRCNERRPYAHVDIDSRTACRHATERLIGFGHRRIGLINAPDIYTFAGHRERGWRDALDAACLAYRTKRSAEPTEENGFRLMRDLLADADPPTAVLCATDRLAVGALRAIANAGLRAGVDVSVIGYDNLPVANYTEPPLTTIEQPIDRAARRMVEMLLALIGGADPVMFCEVWPARLIARASDGPAPRTAAGPQPTSWEGNNAENIARP
jgi:LacI family transcriptional regulator